MIAYTANETATLDHNTHCLRYKEFDAATEGMNLYFLILRNCSIPQIHADASAESIQMGAVEGLATINILIATIVYAAIDTLTVFTDGQCTLQPLIRVAAVAVDEKTHSYIYQ